MTPQRILHPLLMDRHYWRNRLQEQRLTRHGLMIVPRPDLSGAGCDVQEIRFRAHDGLRLWGLLARCPLFQQARPVRLRMIGPCDAPAIDRTCIEAGSVDLLLQVPAGRRLEDRVLDVLRMFEVIESLEGVDAARISLADRADGDRPDEFLIANQLRDGGLGVRCQGK